MSFQIQAGRTLAFAIVFSAAAWSGQAASAQSFVWPLSATAAPSPINAAFGPRIKGSTGLYEFHEGLDLRAPLGTPVYAAVQGNVRLLTDANGCTVQNANDTVNPPCASPLYPGGGRIVQLDHGNHLYTNYFHLSAHAAGLSVGSSVGQGDPIGAVGMTGNATIYHLHFEVRDGSPNRVDVRNPLGYLPKNADAATDILDTSITTVNGSPVLSVTAQAAVDDLNLNEVAVRVFDGNGKLVSQSAGTVVRFNEKLNCGFTATNPTQGITLAPASFNDQSSQYRLTVSFDGLTLAHGGSYEVTLKDVSGLTSSVTGQIL
ncbi:MAG TPA: M23 family metallopeptidase [Thermoanaerobaculia bacterium]|jgi:hypothetical protein|nr:M23 family metallopeptidase [Thermoanaerobaculia bacterium]